MRYFIELAYNGSAYAGWQRQPKARSVQQVLEEAFSMVLRTELKITGCGRTDALVHARQFFAHFDFEGNFPEGFLNRINKVLPRSIAIYQIIEVAADAHARFDATRRSYEYHITTRKNPFKNETAYFFPFVERLEMEKMEAAARLLLQYDDFLPFCKTNHDAKTMSCVLTEATWQFEPERHRMVFYISSNRFLRGMVRLIVGMCLNVGQRKLELNTVKTAMDKQIPLQEAASAPPQGLFLSKVQYPFL